MSDTQRPTQAEKVGEKLLCTVLMILRPGKLGVNGYGREGALIEEIYDKIRRVRRRQLFKNLLDKNVDRFLIVMR